LSRWPQITVPDGTAAPFPNCTMTILQCLVSRVPGSFRSDLQPNIFPLSTPSEALS